MPCFERTVADWVNQRDELALRLFREMGALLARIHSLAFPQADPFVRHFQQELKVLYQWADELANQEVINKQEASLLSSLHVPPLHGDALCHGDFHAVHCVVDQERITAVVDWESAWAGNPAVDLALTHAYLDF